jgi:hypothetical protein
MGRGTDSSPAFKAVAVTKSDATILEKTRALYIGGTGDVAVRMADGSAVTFSAVPVGILPIQVDQVKSTGTTATLILALY